MDNQQQYITTAHCKHRLRYHLIFSTKYRKKCLNEIRETILNSFKYAESISHFKIYVMELDKDHMHLLVSFPPKYSIEQTVRRLKQISTNYIWKYQSNYLRQFYWGKKKRLWTGGYFCSTIGNVSENTIKHYIENQG